MVYKYEDVHYFIKIRDYFLKFYKTLKSNENF